MKVRLPKNNSRPSIEQLMVEAQKAQQEIEKASTQLESKEYVASSGGDAVKVVVTGKLEIKEVNIKPEVVDPQDVEILQDMIMTAVNDALKQASNEKDEVMNSISSKMNIPGMS